MKRFIVAIRCFVVLTVITGFLYPFVVTKLARSLFPAEASGSLLRNPDGTVAGSLLIGQSFKSERYFWPRPSAVDYNPLPSGGTNLGPTSKSLKEKWDERRKAGFSGEMLAASGSGLDPHISPNSAYAQVARVAQARGKTAEEVNGLVQGHLERPQLGFLGQSRVNVLKLNRALDERMR